MIEVTRIMKSDGPLTKRISLDEHGSVVSDGSACIMSRGRAQRSCHLDLGAFADMISSLAPNEAIALGALRANLPDRVSITTKSKLDALNGSAPPDLIARVSTHIEYRSRTPALALIDIDAKAMPDAVRDRVQEMGGYRSALISVVKDLAATASVIRASTSAGLFHAGTGEDYAGSGGLHWFVAVQDGSDIERFLRAFHDRCWLAGFGWLMVGVGGQLLERSLVDRMVYAPERLVFEGAPEIVPPLAQRDAARMPEAFQGDLLNSRSACPDLTTVEQAKLKQVRASEALRVAPEAAKAKADFVAKQIDRLTRRGVPSIDAARVVEEQCRGVLLPSVILDFDDDALSGSTVADVLAAPGRFVGSTLADPSEGLQYGRCKAKVLRRPDGTPWINSFAHGRAAYELQHDAHSVEAAVRAAPQSEVADRFVKLLLSTNLAADEEQYLRDLVCKLAEVKARPLAMKIKAAREQQQKQRATEQRERQTAARTDRRIQLSAPHPDDERLPVLRQLDEVLGSSTEPEPPMRDMDGRPVEVRDRQPSHAHELSAQGSNEEDTDKTRLPAPSLPLLTKHDRFSLAHEIEGRIEYVLETEKSGFRPVALPSVFVDHYQAYRDSVLPRVRAVVSTPLVLPDGFLLAREGLDRERKLVLRIEPALLQLMPQQRDCSATTIAESLEFLTGEWLADVATDFTGKCILIAMALSILERVLLPERPAFFVTAGKRGGGKTTALTMIILAATGKKPPAAAWSSSEEERRKAMLAHLSDGLAALVWDNLPLGAMVACPTLEKVLTTDAYSDRVLGQTANLTVPAFTIMSFTGNNIAPRGDMASRSLITRLEVDRPDPENREFRHSDPISWTLDHRGEILRALYTLLLGNPQLQPSLSKPEKTRFKRWWHLVGSAVENAADNLMTYQGNFPQEWRTASKIDFGALFAATEEQDEDAGGVAEVLEHLHKTWPASMFQASDIARIINDPMAGQDDMRDAMTEFFNPTGRRGGSVITTVVIGKRLKTIVGAPIYAGDTLMKLSAIPSPDNKRRATLYQVRVS